MADAAELILIRHGPTKRPGHLNGRTDVALAEVPDPVRVAFDRLIVSPAKRAVATADGLFSGAELIEDARLWEQNFGIWDGVAFADLPDIGDLGLEVLAKLTSEGGESFEEMVARVRPALEEAADMARDLGGRVAVVAHAGTVRAGLAMAMGALPPALAFQIGHLRATRLVCLKDGFAIRSVNEVLG
ncbi:MAG: histidine phosphatase family protein [Paracoccaceae bacterium]|nr:histidine phosphatase family protein [Paracoccaceae bacterium]